MLQQQVLFLLNNEVISEMLHLLYNAETRQAGTVEYTCRQTSRHTRRQTGYRYCTG